MAHTLPEHFGRYRILGPLGEGGMGAVFLAEDTRLRRVVALKIPHFGPDETPSVIERFYREARMAAQITHPHLCPVYDVDCIDGTHCLTMGYIEGTPMSKTINPVQPWPPVRAVEVVRQLALALQLLHDRGIIHRDLKPANVILQPDNTPVLVDFGLARPFQSDSQQLTTQQGPMGTPNYMAPEQVLGDTAAIGPATDIYALGVILYHLLTGRLPFLAETFAQLGMQIINAPVVPPSQRRADLDPELDQICLSALAKNPTDRPASMKAFAEILRCYLDKKPVHIDDKTVVLPRASSTAVPVVPHPASTTDLPTAPSFVPGAPLGTTPPGAPTTSYPAQAPRASASSLATPRSHAGTSPIVMPTPTREHQFRDTAPASSLSVPPPSPPSPPSQRWGILLGMMVAAAIPILGVVWLAMQNQGAPTPTDTTNHAGSTGVEGGPQGPTGATEHPLPEINLPMIKIPRGTFTMGSPPEEEGRGADERQHEVTFSSDFYLSAHEITIGQFRQFVKERNYTPEGGMTNDHGEVVPPGARKYPWENVPWKQTDDRPVVHITYNDAAAFCLWLTTRKGISYRLPTEAEWEYACRATSTTAYSTGATVQSLDGFANVADRALERLDLLQGFKFAPFDDGQAYTAPVRSYRPNAFGISDMHGNVAEWCLDWYGPYPPAPMLPDEPEQAVRDPRGPSKGTKRVVRGGGWNSPLNLVRSAARDSRDPVRGYDSVGFRVVQTIRSR